MVQETVCRTDSPGPDTLYRYLDYLVSEYHPPRESDLFTKIVHSTKMKIKKYSTNTVLEKIKFKMNSKATP